MKREELLALEYDALRDVLMTLSKAQMKHLYPDIADYEGHNWTREECVRYIALWCDGDKDNEEFLIEVLGFLNS